jgi:hypothetical protein
MKKYLAGMIVAAAAIVASATPSWAFQSTKITTMTATVTTGGSKSATFVSNIRLANNPFGANQATIVWPAGIDPLTQSWVMSDSLVIINSTVTDNNGGIRIYSDNTASDAAPKFVDPTSGDNDDADSKVNVLLKGTSGTTSEPGLPVAWSIKTSTKIVNGANVNTGIQPREPNDSSLPNQTGSNNPYQWLYMTDKSNWDGIDLNNDGDYIDAFETAPLPNGAPFTLLINKSGEHFGQADTEFGVTPDGTNMFVYFEANFTGADVQQAYQTTTMRIESFIQ